MSEAAGKAYRYEQFELSEFFKVPAMRVTTAEFIKGYGALAGKALAKPVTITKNGRDRLV